MCSTYHLGCYILSVGDLYCSNVSPKRLICAPPHTASLSPFSLPAVSRALLVRAFCAPLGAAFLFRSFILRVSCAQSQTASLFLRSSSRASFVPTQVTSAFFLDPPLTVSIVLFQATSLLRQFSIVTSLYLCALLQFSSFFLQRALFFTLTPSISDFHDEYLFFLEDQ